ncbi:MAG: FAD-dependent oxidoreductase [Neomegalonema sp.]|nr:FAD-dependent oxidoreductase [Neomegalonema sp.]
MSTYVKNGEATKIVLIGGGHCHALTLKALAERPEPGIALTLISPEPTAPYTGMLPGFVAGHYQREDLEIDLETLAERAGARLILDRALGVDRESRTVLLHDNAPEPYDLLSINIGISSQLAGVPALAEHVIPAKPLGRLAERWTTFLGRAKLLDRPPALCVIGGGVGGIELAMAMAWRLRREGLWNRGGAQAVLTLVERGDALLPSGPQALRRRLIGALERAGVRLLLGHEATGADAGSVRLRAMASGQDTVLPSDFTVATAGARPQAWLAQTGLALHDGFIAVGPTLQSVDDGAIFAVGDCAHMTHAPREKAGVYAVRQAPVLTENLRRLARSAEPGAELMPYTPQSDYLKLITTGGREAIASKWGLALRSHLSWRIKDRIDRAFMRSLEG